MTDPLTAALDVFTPFSFGLFLVGNVFALMKYGGDTPLQYAVLTGLLPPTLISGQIFFSDFLGGPLTVGGYAATLIAVATVWFLAGGFLLVKPHIGDVLYRILLLPAAALALLSRGLRGIVVAATAPVKRLRNRDRSGSDNTVEAADYSNNSAATTPTTIADLEGDDDEDNGGWKPDVSLSDVSTPDIPSIRGDDSSGGHVSPSTTSDDGGRDWSFPSVSAPALPALGTVGEGIRRRLTQRNRLPAVERVDDSDS